MIGIEISFLTGRFHGNAWQRAHNEGVSEWPPSPWRVLRALVSASYAEGLPRRAVEPLLEKLHGLPRYRLPPASEGHTRQYMPDTEDVNHRKTKVFDTFVAVDGGARHPAPVTIAWPVELGADDRALLSRLCQSITYLGRAESWANLRIVDIAGDEWDCWPDETGPGPATTLLVPASAQARDGGVPETASGSVESRPWTLWEVLSFEGARFRAEGWSVVPGTRLVRYRFSGHPFRRISERRVRRDVPDQPTAALFAIRSSVLPRVYDAVALAERLRLGAMSCSRKVSGSAKPVFSGHGVVANHAHARYLPVAIAAENAARGVIDHVLVVAEGGFDEEDLVALQKLRQIWARGGNVIDLMLTSVWRLEDLRNSAFQIPVLIHGRVWESLTPFVPTRHPKRVRGAIVDSIEEQIRRGCEQLRDRAPTHVFPIGDAAHWARFRRRRMNGGGRRGPDRAFGARVVFERSVPGPLAIGYASHFGLGLFRVVE